MTESLDAIQNPGPKSDDHLLTFRASLLRMLIHSRFHLMLLIFIIFLLTSLPAHQSQSPPSAAGATRTQSAGQTKERGRPADTEAPARRATSKSILAQPLKRSWQYLTDGAVALPPALDSSRVYLALAEGRIVCLETESGSLLWSSDPGGLISSPIAVGDNALYIATQKIAEDRSDAGASLRAVDKMTGLTLWARDYERAFTSPLVLKGDRIYIGSADGSFYALTSMTGDTVWKVQTQDVVRGCALATEGAVYFGCDDGALRGVDPKSGREVWKFQTGGRVVGKPCSDGRAIYFGSDDGFVYSVEVMAARLRWRARTGAAVEASPVMVGEHLIVGSFDNFVYCFARANGNRIWKRRLDNRIAAEVIVDGDAILVAGLRSNQVAVLLDSGGLIVNFYKLESDYEIVAQPVFARGTLLLPTDKGLVVAVSSKAGDEPTNAVKK